MITGIFVIIYGKDPKMNQKIIQSP